MLRTVMAIGLMVALLPFVLTLVYSAVAPQSTLMLARHLMLRPVDRRWVPLERISPALVRAVIAAEDARYCLHGGVDWDALRLVIEEAGEDGPARGASTIAMQTAKNLFLWPGGGYVRKPFEIVLALWIDLVWTKRRTLEVYLNIAEWGPGGIFGAEAGAQRAFGRAAGALRAREAALMAAALPNPLLRNPGRPTRAQARWAATVMARAPAVDAGCLAG